MTRINQPWACAHEFKRCAPPYHEWEMCDLCGLSREAPLPRKPRKVRVRDRQWRRFTDNAARHAQAEALDLFAYQPSLFEEAPQ